MIISSIRAFLGLGLLCSVAYPAALLAFAVVANPSGAEGSLVRDDLGVVRGSVLIAQDFTQPAYLWPRPSAVSYDGGAAGGSNLSPAGQAFRDRVESDLERFPERQDQPVPVDLVTASGSGLDPHVSLEAARYQAARIAQARGATVADIEDLIASQSESVPGLGAGVVVNVLKMNLALDARWPQREGHEQP